MARPVTAGQDGQAPHGSLLITGAGAIVSGDLHRPLVNGDTVRCVDGIITHTGWSGDVDDGELPVMDVNGATIVPGLVDPHVHPVLGDYTPRHTAHDWMASYLHGGVTTMISAGEPHWPGRDRSPAGAKAIAMTAYLSARNLRPAGAKLHAGALLLEPGLTPDDIAELAAAGLHLLGEIGIGGICDPDEAAPLVAAAKAHGLTVPVHVGGASIPGSASIGAHHVVALQPDVASHVNGGPTAPSPGDVETILDGSGAALEVVQAGNIRALRDTVMHVRDAEALSRLQFGSDTPSGTGVIPLSLLRVMAYACALGGLSPAEAVACGSGQTGARYGLDVGVVAPGRPGDVVVLDSPVGSTAPDALAALAIGDTPAVAAVVTDGRVRLDRSRVTPPPRRTVAMRPRVGARG